MFTIIWDAVGVFIILFFYLLPLHQVSIQIFIVFD